MTVDSSYQPKVYRAQGGDVLYITSSGTQEVDGEVNMNSGSSMTFASGSGLALASGSSFSVATAIEVASGGSIAMASGSSINVASGSALTVAAGASFAVPYQVVASSDTTIANSGVSIVTGTTAGPDYVLAAPTVAGQWKNINLTCTSSGVTHRATIYTGSTGRLITYLGSLASGNTITLNTSTQHGIRLVAAGTSGWVVLADGGATEPALSNKST